MFISLKRGRPSSVIGGHATEIRFLKFRGCHGSASPENAAASQPCDVCIRHALQDVAGNPATIPRGQSIPSAIKRKNSPWRIGILTFVLGADKIQQVRRARQPGETLLTTSASTPKPVCGHRRSMKSSKNSAPARGQRLGWVRICTAVRRLWQYESTHSFLAFQKCAHVCCCLRSNRGGACLLAESAVVLVVAVLACICPARDERNYLPSLTGLGNYFGRLSQH